MGIKTKRIKIESLHITKEFLKKLGNILESEIEIRKKDSEEIINKLIEEKKRNIKKFGSKKTKEAIPNYEIESIKNLNKPHYSLIYSINSQEEELTFSSIEELLNTSVFPYKIKSMSFRVNHYNNKYVDISISLDNDYDSIASFYLSSDNESKILKFEKDIKELFTENSNDYNWLFKIPGSKYFILQFLAIVITFLTGISVIKLQKILIPSLFGNYSNLFIFIIVLGLLFLFIHVLRYLYPYYDFDINKKNQLRRNLKKAFWTIVGGVVVGLLVSLISKLI